MFFNYVTVDIQVFKDIYTLITCVIYLNERILNLLYGETNVVAVKVNITVSLPQESRFIFFILGTYIIEYDLVSLRSII